MYVCARARESRFETVYPRAYKPRVRVLYSRNGLRSSSSSSSSSLPLPSLCLLSTSLLFDACVCLFLFVSQFFFATCTLLRSFFPYPSFCNVASSILVRASVPLFPSLRKTLFDHFCVVSWRSRLSLAFSSFSLTIPHHV